MFNENTHVPDEVLTRAIQHAPGHPMAQSRVLTQLQEAYLPAFMWMFDSQRFRAQGRSTLLAHVAILLAMQGERVFLEDFSESMTRHLTRQMSRRFADLVLTIVSKDYPRDRFSIDPQGLTLEYRGRHPR